jgi:hypothetical protein
LAEPSSGALTPTLFIGLGGTGKDVLMRVRRRFYESAGTLGHPLVGYLALDTDPGAFDQLYGEEVSSHLLRQIRLRTAHPPEAISCQVKPADLAQYFEGGMRRFPHVFRWLPSEMNRYGPAALVTGSGQNRLFGRLAFFHRFRVIERAMQLSLLTLLNHAKDPGLLAQWAPRDVMVRLDRLDVVLVYSIAGGTGAGMFLDAGLLARKVAEMLGQGVRAHFTHVAVLPEPFVQMPPGGAMGAMHEFRKRLEANAFAALREMEYFALGAQGVDADLRFPRPRTAEEARPLYEVSWARKAPPYQVWTAPWDSCYLIGGQNDCLATACLTPRDVYQMIADGLFLDVDPGPFGSWKRSLRANLREQTLHTLDEPVCDENSVEVYRRRHSRCFRTFGLASLSCDQGRFRRAAACRLGQQLVAEWWLRPGSLTTQEATRMAREDLEGESGREWPVTNTLLPDDRPLPVSYPSLSHQISRMDGTDNKTWWDLIREGANRLRTEIEDRRYAPPAAEPFSAWRATHELRLQKTAQPAGEAGLALRSFAVRRMQVEPEIETRARCLFLYRLRELGVAGSLQLFGQYAALNQASVKMAERVRSAPDRPPANVLDRLREAQHLPLYSRQAVRWEMLRCVAPLAEHLVRNYEWSAAGEVHAALTLVQRLFATPMDHSGYPELLRRFQQLLEDDGRTGVVPYLRDRFAKFRPVDSRRLCHMSLMPAWDEGEYDRAIAHVLGPEHQPDEPPDWAAVEARVLAYLASAAGRWEKVRSLGEVVLALFPDIKDVQPPSPALAEEFARDLADACEALLGEFGRETSALEQVFRQSNERRSWLVRLCVYSAPYLVRIPESHTQGEADTEPAIVLGLPSPLSEEGPQLRAELQEEASLLRVGSRLGGLQLVQTGSATVLLYQEKVGVALCDYAGLDQLGQQYGRSEQLSELHLDYPALKDQLPEIRLHGPGSQHVIESVELALLGLITGLVSFDQQQFHLAAREGLGKGLSCSLGGRWVELIEQCANQRAVRTELRSQLTAWLDAAASENDGQLLGVLWCAAQDVRETVRERTEEQSGKQQNVDALLTILDQRVLPALERRLEGTASGPRWLRSVLSLAVLTADVHLDDAARRRLVEEWRRLLREFYAPISEALPIPVLRPGAPAPGALDAIRDKLALPSTPPVELNSPASEAAIPEETPQPAAESPRLRHAIENKFPLPGGPRLLPASRYRRLAGRDPPAGQRTRHRAAALDIPRPGRIPVRRCPRPRPEPHPHGNSTKARQPRRLGRLAPRPADIPPRSGPAVDLSRVAGFLLPRSGVSGRGQPQGPRRRASRAAQ